MHSFVSKIPQSPLNDAEVGAHFFSTLAGASHKDAGIYTRAANLGTVSRSQLATSLSADRLTCTGDPSQSAAL